MAITIETDDCIACAACADACPNSCIEVADVAVLKDPDACIDCGICVDTCPVDCISL